MRGPRTAWLLVMAGALLAPVVLVLTVGPGDPATVWSTLAVITGTQAVAAMLLCAAFAARFRSITHVFGIDGAMSLHRVLGVTAAVGALVHVAAIIIDNPANVWLVDAFSAPYRAVAGSVAATVLVVMVRLAQRQHRRWEWWRWGHRAMAVGIVGLISWHVIGLNRLINAWPWLGLFTLFAAAGIGMLVYRGRRGDKYVVTDIRSETPTVCTVTIAPTRTDAVEFDAGQFAWLRLSAFPWAEDHPFTISSPADGYRELEFTFRCRGDWTNGPMASLRPGRRVWVDGPHGAMTLSAADDSPGIVAIAAGVGLTPIISVLRTLAHRQDRRPVKLFIPPTEPLFADELRALMRELSLTVHPVITRPVTADALDALLPPFPGRARYTFFVCGPPQLVFDASAVLAELGVRPDRVLTEQFEMA